MFLSQAFDYTEINQHPVNQAFAFFAAIKRSVGLSRNRNNHRYTIGLSTMMFRKLCGFNGESRTQQPAFVFNLPDGVRGCPRSWDSALGNRYVLSSEGIRKHTMFEL